MKISIIFAHYSEDKKRDELAEKCLIRAASERGSDTELVLIMNGLYPYRDKWLRYSDQYYERVADPYPGKSFNLGVTLARGNIIVYMCNDVYLLKGAIQHCATLLEKYPKYWVTPMHVPEYKMKRNKQLEDGFVGNDRAGDLIVCATKKQIEDVGPMDEVACFTDMINYMNRRIAKGYTVMFTKSPMAMDMDPGVHSFKKQMRKYKMRGYKKEKPLYSIEELKQQSYES